LLVAVGSSDEDCEPDVSSRASFDSSFRAGVVFSVVGVEEEGGLGGVGGDGIEGIEELRELQFTKPRTKTAAKASPKRERNVSLSLLTQTRSRYSLSVMISPPDERLRPSARFILP
jgi:hypothetical protein